MLMTFSEESVLPAEFCYFRYRDRLSSLLFSCISTAVNGHTPNKMFFESKVSSSEYKSRWLQDSHTEILDLSSEETAEIIRVS